MAPELRKRKQAPEPAKPSPKVEKPAGKGKRKAAEQASPSSAKKSKPAKEAPAPKSALKKTTKAKEETPKTNSKKKATVPVEEPAEEPADGEDEEEEENNDALVLATELDSGDDEADGVTLFEEGQDVGTIPSVSKAVREAAASEAASGERGVVYVGRIPHGFYEHEMRQYFSQFGPISRLRLSRNRKTGASKHFAFVEFTERSTAEVVAKTMDNYLLFGHILKCQVVPPARVHEALFKGANRRFKKVPWTAMAGRKLEKPRSESAWGLKVERETKKRADKSAKLKALGYEFEGPEIKAVPAPGAPTEEENGVAENGDAVETKKAIEASPIEEPKVEESKVADSKVEESKVEEPKVKPTKATKAKGGKAKKAKA